LNESRRYIVALHKILNLARHGTPPDYKRWITLLDLIAETAREALGEDHKDTRA
jgi:hypothetical protein